MRGNRPRRAQGAAFVQGKDISARVFVCLTLSLKHAKIDHFFPSECSHVLSLFFKQARARDAVYFKSTKYVKGTPEKAVITEVIPAEIPK